MDMLELIDKKVTDGFLGVYSRLDVLNGQVRRHGEDIAVLKHEAAKIEAIEDEVKKSVLQQNLCAFNCPWKSQMMETGNGPEGMALVKRQQRIQSAKVGVISAGATALAMEILPNILDWIGLVNK